ncbi:hypothetical protein AYO49_02650 [Verrucomicrobiaceae bacterium SCGC AG-212-N21]|nr:hypothetical protein AYO49_02650 [Verrucomicrobiaceae bacterium SCGC AG-212-N21]
MLTDVKLFSNRANMKTIRMFWLAILSFSLGSALESCSRPLRTTIEKSEYQASPSANIIGERGGDGVVLRDRDALFAEFRKYGLSGEHAIAESLSSDKMVIVTPLTKVSGLVQLQNLLVVELTPQKTKGCGITLLSGEVNQSIKFNWKNGDNP